MSVERIDREQLLVDTLGLRGPVETAECEWCARDVTILELYHLPVSEEPVDTELIVVCRECRPEEDPVMGEFDGA